MKFLRKKIVWFSLAGIIIIGGFAWFQMSRAAKADSRYVLAQVTKGTIMSSISGSGQVSTSNQIDIKPKVSGDVISVPVKNGQTVKAGAVIAYVDARDALKAVRDAQVNLQSAQLSLDKLQQPTDALTITQSENSLARAQESLQSSTSDLQKAYDDGYNTIANAFLDLPDLMNNLNTMLFTTDSSINSGQWNIDYYASSIDKYDDKADTYRQQAYDAYQVARKAYDKNFQDYKDTSRFATNATTDSLINESYDTTKSIGEAIKSANNLIQFYKDTMTTHSLKPVPLADTNISNLNTYTGKVNGHVGNLLNIKNSIASDNQTIVNAGRTITEDQQSLAKLQTGVDPLDLASSQLSLKQRQNAVTDAQEKLADYTVRAPFDGTLAAVNVKKGDSASSGTALATLVTQQKLAELSLNEVDVAKVKIGQKATLTFDAIEDLSIAGEVADIDSLGTVSQGVVTYKVKINFDTQDDRIKPGMSVSASIIIDMHQDVLTVPSGAVKTQGTNSYVEVLDSSIKTISAQGVLSPAAPQQQAVQIGLADDTSTEILSGLNEGDYVVSRTISPTTAKTTTQAPSLIGGGTRGAATGGFRGN